MKPATTIGVFFLALIAFGHLLRLLLGWNLVLADHVIPTWPSVLVVIVFGGLSVLICKENKKEPSAP